MEKQFSFENLEAWKHSRNLVTKIYKLIKKFPLYEMYSLSDQIRRAAISVPSNIAEGSGRISTKEQAHFYEIAFASLMEVYCQLLLAVDLGYLEKEEIYPLKRDIYDASKLISGLRKAVLRTEGKV